MRCWQVEYLVNFLFSKINIHADIRKILPAGLLEDPLAAGMARAYNTRTFKVVVSPSGNKVIIISQNSSY